MCKRDEERHVLCLASQLSSYPYHHMADLVTRFKPAQGHACGTRPRKGEGTACHTTGIVKWGDINIFSAKRRLSANPLHPGIAADITRLPVAV